MEGIGMMQSLVKIGLGWWVGLARVCIEYDISDRCTKIAICFNGLSMIVTDTISDIELVSAQHKGKLFYVVGKRAAGCMNDYSERRFGYVPSEAY